MNDEMRQQIKAVREHLERRQADAVEAGGPGPNLRPNRFAPSGYFYRVELDGQAVTIGFATLAELLDYVNDLTPPVPEIRS